MKGHKKFLALSHAFLIFGSILCIAPFWLLVTASLSEESYAVKNGYSFIPKKWSLSAYQFLLQKWQIFGRGYLVTIAVTVIGVLLCLVITMMLAYMLSRPKLPCGKLFNFIIIFTMLFNGGIVSTYIMYSQVFHIKNTLWALIIPNLLTNAFFIIMVKNYFSSNIPEELVEAARIDGTSEFGIFLRIVMPLSKPIIATLALLVGVNYWNDWQNAMYYVDDQKLYSIQSILNAINTSTQYLMQGSGGGSSLPNETARMAAAVIGALPIIIAYPFFQEYFVRGITAGAVKG